MSQFLPFFFFLFLFWATPVAYGSFQARGESELRLQAYAAAMAALDPSCICDLRLNLWQHWIFNPLSEARD